METCLVEMLCVCVGVCLFVGRLSASSCGVILVIIQVANHSKLT